MSMIYSFKTLNQKEKPGFFVYFVAKKKIFKKAVIRNKAKRIAKNAFYQAKKDFLKENLNNDLLLKNKQVIFFLENAIIQEEFVKIIDSFKRDLIKIINK